MIAFYLEARKDLKMREPGYSIHVFSAESASRISSGAFSYREASPETTICTVSGAVAYRIVTGGVPEPHCHCLEPPCFPGWS